MITREELEQKRSQWRNDPELRCLGSPIDELHKLSDALETAWAERDAALAECTRKTLLIAAITHDRDAYKFAAEQAIGMGTAKADMDERDQLKHRVRELEKERDDAIKERLYNTYFT